MDCKEKLLSQCLTPASLNKEPVCLHPLQRKHTAFVELAHATHVLLWHPLHKGCSLSAISASLDYPYLFWEETPFDSSICRTAGTFRLQDHASKRGKWKRWSQNRVASPCLSRSSLVPGVSKAKHQQQQRRPTASWAILTGTHPAVSEKLLPPFAQHLLEQIWNTA